MPARDAVRDAVLAALQTPAGDTIPETVFNEIAQRVFAHQFEHNAPYRGYCERRAKIPGQLNDWRDIPAVPTAAFKEVALVAGSKESAQLTFRTSGTTRGAEKRGTHYILDPLFYERSLLAGFREFVLTDVARMRMISLVPPADDVPDSSLSYMITTVMRELGGAGSTFVASAQHGIDVPRLHELLGESDTPVCLLGTSLSYLHLFEQSGESYALPAGSRLMDTGGFKGEAREITADELREAYRTRLGIDARFCVNEYGMTELSSQYYDADLRDGERADMRVKKGPAWLRPRVVDPETLAPLPRGRTGILQHFDLANIDSVSAVLTEDLAYEVDDGGFVLLGRAPGAAPRGCSIAMDILLNDSRAQ